MKKPVLFIVFNRPDLSMRVFDEIKKAKPHKLYIAADGPRENVPNDFQKCQIVRDIAQKVDWECDVKTLFRNKNLGCKIGVSSAIDWFFDNEEDGIILEDDCVPHQSFFRFCEELLEKYKENKRVFMISGDNFLLGERKISESYYFSKYHFIWGWATWKRAWEKYDIKMKSWPEFKYSSGFRSLFTSVVEANYWRQILDAVYNNKIDTWDYQWAYTMWENNGLSACPNTNLIENIGFDSEATHTKKQKKVSQLSTNNLKFPLTHPTEVLRNKGADMVAYNNFFSRPGIKSNVKNMIKYSVVGNSLSFLNRNA